MKPLPSQEMLRKLLDYDPETGRLTWLPREGNPTFNTRFAGKPALGADHGNGYLNGALLRHRVYAHRVIWKWVTGEEPDRIDHLDGDRSRNVWENLRSVTIKQNNINRARSARTKSGVLGVYQNRDRWCAKVGHGSKMKHLGTFDTIAEAAKARKAADKVLGYHPNHGREPTTN